MALSCKQSKAHGSPDEAIRLAPRKEKELLIAATLQFISAKKLDTDHAFDLAVHIIHVAENDTTDFLSTISNPSVMITWCGR